MRNKQKIYYTLEWGKMIGQRVATGIFTYANPINVIQRRHNKEALHFLEIKKAQMTLDAHAIGTGCMPAYRLEPNFLDFYKSYLSENRQFGNRHLEGSFNYFSAFLKKKFLSPIDVTPDLSRSFRKYLLDHLNGETPANYFARFKKVIKAATHAGYFKVNPTSDILAKANKNKRRKENLEAEEYLQLINAPAFNEEVREAFLFCCYTGLRWCDIKSLTWQQINDESSRITIIQQKTFVEHHITLHPIAKVILDKHRLVAINQPVYDRIFRLPTADGQTKY
ncbi:tyrosine-type recombinase/integrase [Pseudoflavitalea rhizosphaerae]|uniref:tyrosine-type recombinase/integrase n=1 Tax=Pseudoflavitalea rhizosphaerae TaxID=1884793 RepID=UPI0013DF666A|nr:site-specific integrase [Pseudoflavitalea rhizosphaerae]